MIRRQTLLMFNFGAAIALVVIGLLSSSAIEIFIPSFGSAHTLPGLAAPARKELEDTQDMARLRSQALFYYDLAKAFKKAQTETELGEEQAVRYFCYILAAVFALGGFMLLAAKPAAVTPPVPGKAPPTR